MVECVGLFMNDGLLNKYEELKEYISSFGKIAVAFSGGVDSTFLLFAAKDSLKDDVIAITSSLYSFPERELFEAKEYCRKLDVRHFIIRVNELLIDGFSANPVNRCYLCKKEIFGQLLKTAREQGIAEVAEGSNVDDEGDYRPGLMAIKELGVKSPLRHIGFTKQEIRDLSEYFKIPVWNKPSSACLSSRVPYGDIITEEKLKRIEKAEDFLHDLGFYQVRVRLHGDVARIELLPEEFADFMKESMRRMVYDRFKELGFSYVTLDILGYRTGSLNEQL